MRHTGPFRLITKVEMTNAMRNPAAPQTGHSIKKSSQRQVDAPCQSLPVVFRQTVRASSMRLPLTKEVGSGARVPYKSAVDANAQPGGAASLDSHSASLRVQGFRLEPIMVKR